MPGQVGILGNELKGSVAGVFPEGLDDPESWLLNRPVGGRRRAGESKAQEFSGRRVEGRIALEVGPAIVPVVHRLRSRLPLKSRDAGAGMDQGWRAVGLHDKVRSQSKDVPTTSIAVERGEDEVQILHELQVEVKGPAASGGL